jgi:rare lipoprotein A
MLSAISINCFASIALGSNQETGKATVYSDNYQGNKTADGERYNKHAMTGASPNLPLGSKVLVKNQRNGREAIVKINDRESAGSGKVIDLSKSAAAKLGVNGTAPVSSRVVDRAERKEEALKPNLASSSRSSRKAKSDLSKDSVNAAPSSAMTDAY